MFSRILAAIACWLIFGALTANANELDESSPRRLAVSPDGKRCALVSEDKGLRVWEAETGKLIARSEIDMPGTAVAFSPDGKMLIVGTSGTRTEANQPVRGFLYGWSFLDGQLKRLWKSTIVGQTMAIAFEPHGKWFVANTVYATLGIYRAEDGKLLRNWQELGNSPSDLAISPDGKTIVTAGQALILWDSTREKSLEEIADPEKPLSAELSKRFMKAKSADRWPRRFQPMEIGRLPSVRL